MKTMVLWSARQLVAQNTTNEKDIEFKKCEEHISHDSEQQSYNFLGII
jgi:hypothetical protein